MSAPSVTFFSGAGSVTGANFLLEASGKKILVDCGLVQEGSGSKDENQNSFPYDPASIDFLFITHAHMDHIGRVPKLVRDGFKGVIYSTPETKEIAELMFADAVHIMEMEAKEKGISPLYFPNHAREALALWKTAPYHQKLSLSGDIEVIAKDAGHILGSAMYEFLVPTEAGRKKVVFTGDLGNSPSPLLKDTELIADADYLVMESVYGDRNHESKEERHGRFVAALTRTIARGGAVVIPAFSLERTQVILYEINNLVEEGVIPSVPVFLDSPLGIHITAIYERISKHYNQGVKEEIAKGDRIFQFPKLVQTARRADSEEIAKTPNPKIIIAGSGMSAGGRVVGHEARYLPDSKSTILLMGYQAVGTLGRQLAEGMKKVVISGSTITVAAEVERIDGYSSHKDSDHLLEFVENTRDTVKKVFVVMGEPKASLFLTQRLRDYIGVNAIVPEKGNKYILE